MVRSSHITRLMASLERYYLCGLARWVDRFVNLAVRTHGCDELRRARVLIGSCWSTAAWAIACFGLVYYLEGLSPTAIAFVIGGLLISANPFLLLRSDS